MSDTRKEPVIIGPPEKDWCGQEVPTFQCGWPSPQLLGTHQIGFHDKRGKERNKPTLSGKAASATPMQFRDALIGLALHSRSLAGVRA